jgi:hypothetical protein
VARKALALCTDRIERRSPVAFSPHPEGVGFLLPSSGAKHTVERFSLSDDRKNLSYEITVEDSTHLAAPARSD